MERIEERLRASLRARAQDVEPTPALWERVDERIRARRRWAIGAWTLGTAAAILAAVAVVPGLLPERSGVDVVERPAGPTTTVAPTDAVVAAIVPEAYVSTDGDAIRLRSTTDGAVLRDLVVIDSPERESVFVDVAVQPGADQDVGTVAYMTVGEGAWSILLATWNAESCPDAQADCGPTITRIEAATGPLVDAADAPTMRWSPDGRHLAWLLPDGDLTTLPVPRGSLDGGASFALDVPTPVTLEDWVWTEGMGTPTAGALYLAGPDGGLYGQPIERQGDGELALPQGPAADLGIGIDVADAHVAAGTGTGPRYLLGISADGAVTLRWETDGDAGARLPVPAALQGADADTIAMEASGDAVLLQAENGVWLVTRDGQMTALPSATRAASLLRPSS